MNIGSTSSVSKFVKIGEKWPEIDNPLIKPDSILFTIPFELFKIIFLSTSIEDQTNFLRINRYTFFSERFVKNLYTDNVNEIVSRSLRKSIKIPHRSLLANVTELNLDGFKIKPGQLKSLKSHFLRLNKISLRNCDLSDELIKELRGNNAQELDLSNNPKLTGSSFDHLPFGLRKLTAARCSLNDYALRHLSKRNLLEEIDISYNPEVTGKTFCSFPPSVTSIHATNCSLKNQPLHELSERKLTFLDISQNPNLRNLQIARLPDSLVELHAANCALENPDLSKFTNLRTLDLSDNVQIKSLCNVPTGITSLKTSGCSLPISL